MTQWLQRTLTLPGYRIGHNIGILRGITVRS
jgi:hypothetical protein